MPRNMTPELAAALQQPVVPLSLFVSITIGTNVVNVWSGNTPITWNGLTFTGVGTFGDLSTIEETYNVDAKGITLTLSGIPNDLVSDVVNEYLILQPCTVWTAVMNNGVPIATPFASFSGLTDELSLKDTGSACNITIAVESALVDLNRPCFRRYDADDAVQLVAQRAVAVGLPATTIDLGFTFIPTIAEATIYWGSSPSSSNNI